MGNPVYKEPLTFKVGVSNHGFLFIEQESQ